MVFNLSMLTSIMSQYLNIQTLGIIVFYVGFFFLESFVLKSFLKMSFKVAVWRMVVVRLVAGIYMILPCIILVVGLLLLYMLSPNLFAQSSSVFKFISIEGMQRLIREGVSIQESLLFFSNVATVALIYYAWFYCMCYAYTYHCDSSVDKNQLKKTMLCILFIGYASNLLKPLFMSLLGKL